jgi:hypothetical protein
MKNVGLIRIFLASVCGVFAGCADSVELDRAADGSDDDEVGVVSQALTLPAADRATTLVNADDPAYFPATQGPAASGLCLDAENGGYGNGKLQLWPCHGQDNQRWALDMATAAVDATSPRAIANAYSGLCLEASSYNDGAPVRPVPCRGTASQQWHHTHGGQLRHRDSGKCLDATASSGSIGQGTVMQLWTCHGGGNQRWKFGSTIFRSAASGRCLDVHTPGGQPASSVVQIWDCHGNANQRWQRRFAEWDGGQLVGDVNGNCLTASGTANGSAVTFQPCGTGSQLFSYLADGSLYHQASKRCLDVISNFGYGNGTGLQLYDCHGQANQRWSTR